MLSAHPYIGQSVDELIPVRYVNNFDLLLKRGFDGHSIVCEHNFHIKGIDRMTIQVAMTPICISEYISYILINLSWDRTPRSLESLSFLTSHQLRAPLSNILSLSDLLNHPSLETFNYSKTRNLLADINRQAQELDKIVLKLNSIINQDLTASGFQPKRLKNMINYIMLVDDDPMVNSLHKMLLSKYVDMKVTTFTDPLEALAYLDENPPDLIFLDLNMPVINGFEFLEKLQQRAKPVDVIIVSSSVNTNEKIRASTYDLVKDFLSKPLTYEKLKKILT